MVNNMDRIYYEAYDDRYIQVHTKNLQWASHMSSPIVTDVIQRFDLSKRADILEIGCGEGRDASFLLKQRYRLIATDISPEAIRYCRAANPQFAECFQVLDCLTGKLDVKFDYIYAVAVVHMLVNDSHRAAFYRFIREHLKENGIGLICTMGDGSTERKSDISTAFELRERNHGETGEKLILAETSCRMVDWETFLSELHGNGLYVLEHGLTAVEPDFPVMMYAVIRKSKNPA